MFQQDRAWIENKYHLTDAPFDPYRRMAYHGTPFDPSTGLDDDAICRGLDELAPELRRLPHPVAKARAVAYVMARTRLCVSEHDWFVGLWSLNRLAGRVTAEPWGRELFRDILPGLREPMEDLNASGACAIWMDFDHVVPDWDAILRLGFPGLLRRIREARAAQPSLTPEQAAFFDGMELEYEAVLELLDRLCRYARTLHHEKADAIAACLLQLRDGAPRTLYEAMQLIYLYFILSECFDSYQVRSLGNGLDASLYRFYQNDLRQGICTETEIREYFRYFLMQWAAIGNYWGQPFYLGGTRPDGESSYTELSYLILDVYDELGIYNPKIQLKINENTPDRLLYKVFDMIRRGHSSLVFCCEPGMIRAVMSYGATYEEALTMDIRGCYETGIRAKEVSTGTGYVNAAKAVEYVFTCGWDRCIKKQVGLRTAPPQTLTRFEDFYHAVLRQWGHLIEQAIAVSLQYEPYLSFVNPSNLYSATVSSALVQGRDAYQSGVKFNNTSILCCGFATLVDAVMAVKEFVYDRNIVTPAQLGDALAQNWAGFEALHTQILKSPHKYGNDDPETDRYAEALSSFYVTAVNNRPNARGGVYKASIHSAMEFVWEGEKTGATPDGRFAGEELSKNASASVGMDRNGITALLHSALHTHPDRYCESHCLDVMLHPSAVSGPEGLQIMKAVLMTYLKGGGMSIQFNVLSAETLRDAQKHPETYKNLQVRVCGWNVLWNNLSAAEQNAYIRRAENLA